MTAVAFAAAPATADGPGEEVADEQQLGVLVALDDDGLIALWRPFEDRDEALAAAGLGPAAGSDHGSP